MTESKRVPWTGHGKYKTRIYSIYHQMNQRCLNPYSPNFKRYGQRWITICDEWLGRHGFERFYQWSMENGYSDELTIDRIDNDGNYEPGNCRWDDRFTQNNNFSRNRYYTYNGETHSLSVWGRLKPNGLNYDTLRSRLRDGWSVDDAFSTPKCSFDDDTGDIITINGESHNVTHWCNITGISKSTFYRRLKRGWSVERAATEKSHERHIMKRYRKYEV